MVDMLLGQNGCFLIGGADTDGQLASYCGDTLGFEGSTRAP